MNLKFSVRKSHVTALLLAFTVISCKKDIVVEPVDKQSFLMELPLAANDARIDPKVLLGSKIFSDPNLSVSDSGKALLVQSCASCHVNGQGFAAFGTKSVAIGAFTRRFIGGFGEGAVTNMFGDRMPPGAAYATFSPKLFRPDLVAGLPNVENEFFGGLFWDGRATGYRLGNPAAEQAQGPFLNPVEQNHPRSIDVLLKIQQNLNGYYSSTATRTLWQQVWGNKLNVTGLLPDDPKVQLEYDRLGKSIAAFEASNLVNKFSSKFDTYFKALDTTGILTPLEVQGLNLFTLNCGACHAIVNPRAGAAPLFTDFGYDNIGVPKTKDHPTRVGGTPPVDLGLGGFLATSGNAAWLQYADGAKGKFKTPTLRNIAKGELLPSGAINRRFMHNGVFTTLEQVVHYYNTRSVPRQGWSKTAPAGRDPRNRNTPGFQTWPAPEYPATFIGAEVGNMGMTTAEELAIVAFMKTLSDN